MDRRIREERTKMKARTYPRVYVPLPLAKALLVLSCVLSWTGCGADEPRTEQLTRIFHECFAGRICTEAHLSVL